MAFRTKVMRWKFDSLKQKNRLFFSRRPEGTSLCLPGYRNILLLL
ncbi:hypothetical protein [Bacterioplanoides sp.]